MIQIGGNQYLFGRASDITPKTLFANTGGANLPGHRYSVPVLNAWQFSNDGINWLFSVGSIAPLIADQVLLGATGGSADQSTAFAFAKSTGVLTVLGTNIIARQRNTSLDNMLVNTAISAGSTFAGTSANNYFHGVQFIGATLTATRAVCFNVGIGDTDPTSKTLVDFFKVGGSWNPAGQGSFRSNAVYFDLGSLVKFNLGSCLTEGTGSLGATAAATNSASRRAFAIGVNSGHTRSTLVTASDVTNLGIMGFDIKTTTDNANLNNQIHIGQGYTIDSTFATLHNNSLFFGVGAVDMMYVGGNAGRFFLNRLRPNTVNADNTATNYIVGASGIAPTTSPADAATIYIKDYQNLAGKASHYLLTEDLRRLSLRDAATDALNFYKSTGGGSFNDQYLAGAIRIEGEEISDSVLTNTWSSALDNGAFIFTLHASLAAFQTWINANITGSRASGTKWIVRAATTSKVGRNPDPVNVKLTYIREI